MKTRSSNSNNKRWRKVQALFGVGIVLLLSACGGQQPDLTVVEGTIEPVEMPMQGKGAAVIVTPTNTTEPQPTSTNLPQLVPETVSTPAAVNETEPLPASGVRPPRFIITPITGIHQAYTLSCESRAAVDWAGYYGLQIYESDFQFGLPLSDNPELGFVGSANGVWGQVPPYDYGVHAAPVAALLREYGLPARDVKQFDLERLKDVIAAGHPVITWVIGNSVGGVPFEYTDSAGNKVIVAAYEHVVIVIGYDDEKNTIIYMNNGDYYEMPASVFDNSWSVLERMALYYGED
jgi:uncharacterized protein YvpB